MSIVFVEPDSPDARETFARFVRAMSSNIPVMGLVVKVREDEGGEQIVNWMFADVQDLKALALTFEDLENTD